MKLTWAWLTAVLAVIPCSAGAQTEQGLADCATVDDTLQRLACYDELASSVGLEPPEVIAIPEAYALQRDEAPASAGEIPATGEWTVSVDSDSDGDPSAVTLSSWAVSGASTEGYAISLTISCQRGRTGLSIRWQDYLGSWTDVTTQIGTERPNMRRWNLSADGRSSFYSGRTLSFIASLIEAGNVSFEVTPYVESPVVAEFDTSGLGEAFAPWHELCRR
jgi:type VI secretion system protein VasI